jgi:Xaa-Pro aminopeptidase
LNAGGQLNALLDVVEGVREGPEDLALQPEADLEFSASEYSRRFGRAVAGMTELGIDALVLAQPANVRYFTGLQTWLWKPLIPTIAVLIREPGRAILLGPGMDREGFASTSWTPELAPYSANEHPGDALAGLLKSHGLERKRLGFELGRSLLSFLTPEVVDRTRAGLPAVELRDGTPICLSARMLKSPEEISRLRQAAALTATGFAQALDAAQPGSSEQELTAIAAAAMISNGSLPGFAPMTVICRVGPATYRQNLQFPSEHAVAEGQQIFLDGGCEYRGYQTDIMRSGVLGKLPASAEEHFGLVDEAIQVASESLRPGVPLGEAHRAVRRFASANGLEADEQPFGIGHGIGLDRWELPMVTDNPEYSEVEARQGMVLCLEPSLGSPTDRATEGVFLMEDEIGITADGTELVSDTTPRGVQALDNR